MALYQNQDRIESFRRNIEHLRSRIRISQAELADNQRWLQDELALPVKKSTFPATPGTRFLWSGEPRLVTGIPSPIHKNRLCVIDPDTGEHCGSIERNANLFRNYPFAVLTPRPEIERVS